ncbi:MAG: hypothetical protein WC447_03460, partial [Candidatus Paceibacterota bacterium]
FFTDKYCGLTKEVFDKLAKEKYLKIKINQEILNIGDATIQLVYYFKFKISIDKIKLAECLDEYLCGFIKNQYNDGTKYAYTKQVKEISDAIKKLISAGFPAESLLIDNAQIFPKNKMDIRPTDGDRQEAILLYDFLDTVLAMEKEGLLKVLDIKYRNEVNKLFSSSNLLWSDPIKIKIGITNKFYQAEIAEIKKTEMLLDKLEKDIQEEAEENNRKMGDFIQPLQNTNFVYNPNTGDDKLKGAEKEQNTQPIQQIKIRNITLNQENLMIEINNGEKIISFKSRKSKGENEETKFFKIVYHLWEFREEIDKNNKIIVEGDWITISNLAKGAESTEGATLKNISRLKDKFSKEGVPIEIRASNNGRYKLIIQKN